MRSTNAISRFFDPFPKDELMALNIVMPPENSSPVVRGTRDGISSTTEQTFSQANKSAYLHKCISNSHKTYSSHILENGSQWGHYLEFYLEMASSLVSTLRLVT